MSKTDDQRAAIVACLIGGGPSTEDQLADVLRAEPLCVQARLAELSSYFDLLSPLHQPGERIVWAIRRGVPT